MQSVTSFDVFETLVTRPFAPPHKLFSLIATAAKRGHDLSIDPFVFEAERASAEKRARKKRPNSEVTIGSIYDECRTALNLSKEDVAILIACELELEIELSRPLLTGRALLEEARGKGQRIIFISDMYLPGSTLRAILARNGCWQDGDHLYVSCEVGATKGSGEMFRHVLQSESISADEMVHVGNHPQSDVESPRRLGIAVEPFLQGNLNARETDLAYVRGYGDTVPSLLAGCSRLARLGNTETIPQRQKVREIAASAAGPFITGYVLWILRRAKAQKIKRLYFIARDGFILLKVAKELAGSVDPSIELRYLYGSRQAWHFPASRGIGLENATWVWAWTTSYSVSTLLSRVDLAPEAVASLLESAGLPPGVWNEPMTRENELKMKKVFLLPDFQTMLRQKAEKQRRLFVDYLEQEGFFSGIDCAIVDVGWRANLQDSLGLIMEEEGYQPVSGFYVGLNNHGAREPKGERSTYLFDRRFDRKWRLPIAEPQSCIEAFCSANHGSAGQYRAEGDTIVPVLQAWDPALFQTWGLEVFQTVVCAYAAEFAKVLRWTDDVTIDPVLSALTMATTWSNPTFEEAECLGCFPFVEDQVGIGAEPMARSLPWRHFARIVKSHYAKSYRVIWMQGSLRLTPQPRSSLLRLAHYVKNARESFFTAKRGAHVGEARSTSSRSGK
jgi:FMN phosphatase YigB (HAD superfamily)